MHDEIIAIEQVKYQFSDPELDELVKEELIPTGISLSAEVGKFTRDVEKLTELLSKYPISEDICTKFSKDMIALVWSKDKKIMITDAEQNRWELLKAPLSMNLAVRESRLVDALVMTCIKVMKLNQIALLKA